jgi:hypothetical protein
MRMTQYSVLGSSQAAEQRGERFTVRGVTEPKRMLQTVRRREHLTAIHRIARTGLRPSSSSNRASVSTQLPIANV